MCGIVGILHHDERPVEVASVRRMAAQIRHRGPDATGATVDGPVGLGHTRLSIIDLAGGRQPMATPNGALQVTFNHMTSPLEHVHYDVFAVPDEPIDPFEGLTVMFQYNKQGAIDWLLVPFESSVDDIVFRRVAERAE